MRTAVAPLSVTACSASMPTATHAATTTGARRGSASTTDSRAVSPEPNRTIWPGPHSRPARSPGCGGRAPAEKSESCDTEDTGRTVEHAFDER